MSKELVNLVQEKLKEDSWTRATISNYSEKDLEKLSDIVKSAKAEGCVEEIKEIADEQLSHSKDNISALYISGMLSLKLGSLDNSSLENLVDIFQNNHKESIVIDICEKIRQDDPSNKFALRILASIYEQTSNDKIWEIYEEIIKVDMSEAEYVKKLAEHYASTGEKADAEKSIADRREGRADPDGGFQVRSVPSGHGGLRRLRVSPSEGFAHRSLQPKAEGVGRQGGSGRLSAVTELVRIYRRVRAIQSGFGQQP